MDTSETYIKMRRKAFPDLGMGQPPVFSMEAEIIWHTTFVCTDIKGDFYYSDKDEGFQLERQDQLQEMMSNFIEQELGTKEIKSLWGIDNSTEIKQAFIDFAHWLGEQYGDEPFVCVPTNCFETGEQLWLAFVMKERWSKTWNGEDWAPV